MKLRQSRPLPLFMILVFSWLVTYQLCDATEDTVEDLNARAQIAAQPNPSLSAPQAPDTDPDTLVPQVRDQALVTGQSYTADQGHFVTLPSEKFATVANLVDGMEQNHSPPGYGEVLPDRIGHSNEPFVSSIQSNAPPAA
jgi:hypothetical protein